MRFEHIGPDELADVVTLRAVRVDAVLADLLARLVVPGGQLFCFGTPVTDDRFSLKSSTPLPDGSTLFVLDRRGV